MDKETISHRLKNAAKSANPQRKEGRIAKAIESQTSRIPSDAFLWAAGGVMATSLVLKIMKLNHTALFIGQWAAPLLLFGVYNKIVKVHGHDQDDTDPD